MADVTVPAFYGAGDAPVQTSPPAQGLGLGSAFFVADVTAKIHIGMSFQMAGGFHAQDAMEKARSSI